MSDSVVITKVARDAKNFAIDVSGIFSVSYVRVLFIFNTVNLAVIKKNHVAGGIQRREMSAGGTTPRPVTSGLQRGTATGPRSIHTSSQCITSSLLRKRRWGNRLDR